MSDQPSSNDPIDVRTVLAVSMDQFAALAWQRMGMQSDTFTGKIYKDIAQAKLAIEACSRLSELIEAELDESDRRQVQNLIRDLKVNFVEQSK